MGDNKCCEPDGLPEDEVAAPSRRRQPTPAAVMVELQETGGRQEVDVWNEYLSSSRDHYEWVANVDTFKHAPFASKWKEMVKEGMMVEVPNAVFHSRAPNTSRKVYWVGTVVAFAGYKALVKYEPVREDVEEMPVFAWIPLMSHVTKHVGYCVTNGILLLPVNDIEAAVRDLDVAAGAYARVLMKKPETIPVNLLDMIVDEVNSKQSRFHVGEFVEALDKSDCSRRRLGLIDVILGDRVHVEYFGLEDDDEGFWFNQNSVDIDKFGFCSAIGANIVGVRPDLQFPILARSEFKCTPDGVRIEKQMIFEMRHPVFPHKIVAGYVADVLKNGYFVAGTDWTKEDELVEMVMHVTSDYILPVNFCRDHRVNFDPPIPPPKEDDPPIEFSWREFLRLNSYKKLDVAVIIKDPNPFAQGSKLEAAKITNPTYLGPATVTEVAGRLLRLHFDGFPRTDLTSFQWVSCDSPDIYPLGYSQMVGHKLSGKPDPPSTLDTIIVGPVKKRGPKPA